MSSYRLQKKLFVTLYRLQTFVKVVSDVINSALILLEEEITDSENTTSFLTEALEEIILFITICYRNGFKFSVTEPVELFLEFPSSNICLVLPRL